MELRLTPHIRNSYPLRGLLIKAGSIQSWVAEIQLMELSLDACKVYPIPDTVANSIWGCLVLPAHGLKSIDTGKHERCQMLAPHIFLPEYSILYPKITQEEVGQLFSANKHILHPEFGWVELEKELDFSQLLAPLEESEREFHEPEEAVFIPQKIKSFQIKPLEPEEILENLESNAFPKRQKMEDEPLDLIEKGKLSLYEMLFKKEEGEKDSDEKKTEKTGFMKGLESLLGSAGVENDGWSKDMKEDYESLERRNQKQLDKLLDLLEKNPEEALKYAIPLDPNNTGRGGTYSGDLDWNLRWGDFSLFGNPSHTGGGAIDLGDGFHQLEAKYRKTAKTLIEKGEHKKAAFVYMKLLKDYYMAAQTLENAEYYEEAASIYLKHLNNKAKAAKCYEKGKMTLKAIELYKVLKNNEKIGDLYLDINNREKADLYFKRVIDANTVQHRFVKASLIAREKMAQPEMAQQLLLTGWRKDKSPVNCLNAYFSAISDQKELTAAIEHIYSEEVNKENQLSFLEVLKSTYNKKPECAERVKEMAYEIVAKVIPSDSSVVANLRSFNKGDRELMKDTMRFKLKKK